MSIEESIAGLKYAVNDTIGTEKFEPLNKLIERATGDKTYIADKTTLDALVATVGATNNTGGGSTTGTVNAKLNNLIDTLNIVNTNTSNIITNQNTAWEGIVSARDNAYQANVNSSNANTNAANANTNAYNASTKADSIISTLNTINSKLSFKRTVFEKFKFSSSTALDDNMYYSQHTIPSSVSTYFTNSYYIIPLLTNYVESSYNATPLPLPHLTIGDLMKSGSTYYIRTYYYKGTQSYNYYSTALYVIFG